MTEQQNSGPEILIENNPSSKSSDPMVIAGSILLGAIIISATMLYMFKSASGRLDSAVSALQDSAQKIAAQAATAIAPSVVPTNQNPAIQPSAAAPAAVAKITLKPSTPFLGSSNAKVTVVEYADYQCPFCEKWYSQVLPSLKSKYISTGKIKYFYQDFAFLGPDSNTAAEATHCAQDQNKYWQYHDYLFTHQGQEGSGWATADHQKEFAKALGLNTTQFGQCLDSGKYKQEVLDETAAGKSYGVSGTPSVFVNGKIIVGAQPFSVLDAAITAALK